jgi:ABC-type uncharacterized transport system substrate-binding protein
MTALLRRSLASLVPLAAVTLMPAAAAAHPHIWIDAIVTVQVENERIDAVRVEWTFDEFFSAVLLDDFDLDRSGGFDAEEVNRIYEAVEPNLRILGYMTHVQAALDYQKLERIRGFDAVVDDGLVRFAFEATLPEPVDPRERRVSVSLFDETYYIAISLKKSDPIRVEGRLPTGCDAERTTEQGPATMWGVIVADAVRVSCAAG